MKQYADDKPWRPAEWPAPPSYLEQRAPASSQIDLAHPALVAVVLALCIVLLLVAIILAPSPASSVTGGT